MWSDARRSVRTAQGLLMVRGLAAAGVVGLMVGVAGTARAQCALY